MTIKRWKSLEKMNNLIRVSRVNLARLFNGTKINIWRKKIKLEAPINLIRQKFFKKCKNFFFFLFRNVFRVLI